MTEGQWLSVTLSIFCLAFSAFFSSSEAAFLSISKTRVAHLVSTGAPRASQVASMIQQPERLLSTILLGNNLVNVAFAALVTAIIVPTLGRGLGIVVATGVATAVLLIAGETIPKTLAISHAEKAVFIYSRPLKWVETLLLPVVLILQWVTGRVNSLFRGGAIRGLVTEGELRTMIDIGEAEGAVEPAEAEMLENVFRFGDRQVREVMTPRPEIVSIERGATLREFLKNYAEHPHTRFPVYRGDVDNIIGIVSAKDILRAMSARGMGEDDTIGDLIRDAFFVPEMKRIAVLFDELRRSGNQMAIAVDEYGGLAGLVTLKQLSEEVVGPVGEEGAGPEEEYETIDRNTFQIEGGMSIGEANEEMEIDLPEGDFETVAGFALDVLGHIPTAGERFDHGNLRFEITRMDNLKIEVIKVTRARSPEDGGPFEADTG